MILLKDIRMDQEIIDPPNKVINYVEFLNNFLNDIAEEAIVNNYNEDNCFEYLYNRYPDLEGNEFVKSIFIFIFNNIKIIKKIEDKCYKDKLCIKINY
jgi:hypothetical protein